MAALASRRGNRRLENLVAVIALTFGLVGIASVAVAKGASELPTQTALREAAEDPTAFPGPEFVPNSVAAQESPLLNLDRQQASELFENVFGDQVEHAETPFTDLKVDSFISDNQAVVSSPGTAAAGPNGESEAKSILDASFPIRVENDDGDLEPIDLTLESRDGSLQSANPNVEVLIPQQLGEGISFPEAGINIRPQAMDGDQTPSNINELLAFYPEVQENTDFAVVPTPTGVETLTLIRSVEAPDTQALDVILPPGNGLIENSLGGAEVLTATGEPSLQIMPPTAIDAAGKSVQVEMSVSGTNLEVTAHPTPETVYPVMVDPTIVQSYKWWHNGEESKVGLGDWRGLTTAPAYGVFTEYAGPGFQTEVPGLDIADGMTSGAVPAGAQGYWNLFVPRFDETPKPTSFIQSMYIEDVGFFTKGNLAPDPHFFQGLWNEEKATWRSVQSFSGESGDRGGGVGYWFRNESPSEVGVKTAGFNLSNAAAETKAKERIAFVGTVAVYFGDTDVPKWGEIKSGSWMNASGLVPFSVSDSGLGIKRVDLTEVKTKAGWQPISQAAVLPCVGNVTEPCPRTFISQAGGSPAPLTINAAGLEQGIDTVKAVAKDPVENSSVPLELKVKVDHTAPTIALSGSLTEQATLGDGLNEYKLKYTASDGNATVAQSGVVSTELKVDSKLVEPKYAPGCATQNCSISREWTLDASQFSYGKHVVEVTATDGVGLKTTQTLPIELLDVQQPPIAAYPLDEGTGKVAHDVSGGAHEGTLSAKGAVWAPGKYGSALKFDGEEGCVSIPDSAALRLREEFTLESWVKPEGELLHDPAIFKESSEGFPSYSLGIGFNTAGKPEGQLGKEGKNHQDIAASASLEANVWSHLAVTYDGAKLRLYVNGALVATKAVEKPSSASLGLLTIGCSALGGQHFKGRIDEVRIYNRALFAGEVAIDQGVPIQTPAAAPIAAYPLDEGTGTIVHDTSGGLHEGAFSAEGVEWAPGKYGNALQFNGTKGYVNIPDSPALRLSEEFTLEAWVKPEGELIHDPVITKLAEGFSAYALGVGMTTAGRAEGQIGTEAKGHTDAVSPSPFEANVWSHLALTFDGANLRLYVNGALVATKAVEKTNAGALGPLRIGGNVEQRFKGRIDEVRIYNRALEAGEVALDKEAPVQTPRADPVAAYPLDEGIGTVANDVSGGAHNGILSAEGVSWAPGRFGNALRFNGVKGCVTIPDSSALQLREEFTLEAWVRPEGELLHLPAVAKQAEGFPAYALGVGFNTAGKAEGQIGTEAKGHTDIASIASVEANIWQHEALTFDGSKLRLFVNGELVATKAVEKTNGAAVGPLEIGCSSSGHFRGRIDEVRIYNRALEAGEVASDVQTPLRTPAADPVAAYPLDEGIGTVANDVSGGAHNGILSAEGVSWAPGRFGNALRFNGVKGCVTIPDSSALQLREEFTLEAWVRPEGELLHLPAVAKQAEGFPAYALGVGFNTAGKAEGQIGTEAKGHTDIASIASVEANIWQHEALTFDGSKLRLFVNGELVATKAVEKTNGAAVGPLEIGCSSSGHFRGRIDEVRIYSVALRVGEVGFDSKAPVQAPQRGPVAAYSLDEGEGSVATDVTKEAHDGILSAEGVSWAPGRFGNALRFNGVKGCVTIPDSSALQLREEFTLEAWVRPEGELLHLPAVAKQAEGFPAYALGVGFNTAGKAEGQIGTEAKGHTDIASIASVEANIWQHEALTFDGSKLRLFVNGELVATKAVEKTNGAAVGPLEIGCSSSGHFRGRIDEVRIYNRALEAGEVASDRHRGVSEIYAATVSAGNPVNGGKILDREWADIDAGSLRTESIVRSATQQRISCPQNPSELCVETRELRNREGEPPRREDFNSEILLAHGPTAPRPVGSLLTAKEGSFRKVADGLITKTKEPWQTLPVEAGTRTEVLELRSNQTETEPQASWRFWVITDLGLPLKVQVISGQKSETNYYSYNRSSPPAASLPPDFFAEPEPTWTETCSATGSLGAWNITPSFESTGASWAPAVLQTPAGPLEVQPKGTASDQGSAELKQTGTTISLVPTAISSESLVWNLFLEPGQKLVKIGQTFQIQTATGVIAATISSSAGAPLVGGGTGSEGAILTIEPEGGLVTITPSATPQSPGCITPAAEKEASEVQSEIDQKEQKANEEEEAEEQGELHARTSGQNETALVTVWVSPQPALSGTTVGLQPACAGYSQKTVVSSRGKVRFGGCSPGTVYKVTVPALVTSQGVEYKEGAGSRSFRLSSSGHSVFFHYTVETQSEGPGGTNPSPSVDLTEFDGESLGFDASSSGEGESPPPSDIAAALNSRLLKGAPCVNEGTGPKRRAAPVAAFGFEVYSSTWLRCAPDAGFLGGDLEVSLSRVGRPAREKYFELKPFAMTRYQGPLTTSVICENLKRTQWLVGSQGEFHHVPDPGLGIAPLQRTAAGATARLNCS